MTSGCRTNRPRLLVKMSKKCICIVKGRNHVIGDTFATLSNGSDGIPQLGWRASFVSVSVRPVSIFLALEYLRPVALSSRVRLCVDRRTCTSITALHVGHQGCPSPNIHDATLHDSCGEWRDILSRTMNSTAAVSTSRYVLMGNFWRCCVVFDHT